MSICPPLCVLMLFKECYQLNTQKKTWALKYLKGEDPNTFILGYMIVYL